MGGIKPGTVLLVKVQRPRPELPGLLMAKLCAGFQGEADAALGHKAAVAERKASGGGGHGRWHRQWCSTRSGGRGTCSGKNARDVIPTMATAATAPELPSPCLSACPG